MTGRLSDNPWITGAILRPGAAMRLICFPAAGASAAFYRSWSALLPPEIEVCPAVLPGRERRIREAPFTHMPGLVEAAVEGLESLDDLPMAIFGHSLGAWIGYEVALRLEASGGTSPLHLFAAACAAPQIGDPRPQFHQLPDPEFIEAVRRFGGTPETIFENPELMQLLLPTLRADFTVYETYRYEPSPQLRCGISAWGGDRDHGVAAPAIAAWGALTVGDFESRTYSGDHFFLHTNRDEVIGEVAEKLATTVG